MNTGDRIKAARKKAGLTQAQLGEKLGISYQTIAQWENNLRNPKMDTILRIEQALGCQPGELLPDWAIKTLVDFAGESIAGAARYNLIMTGDAQHNERLLNAYALLNEEGQQKAVERVEELTEIPKYQKETPPDGDPEA